MHDLLSFIKYIVMSKQREDAIQKLTAGSGKKSVIVMTIIL